MLKESNTKGWPNQVSFHQISDYNIFLFLDPIVPFHPIWLWRNLSPPTSSCTVVPRCAPSYTSPNPNLFDENSTQEWRDDIRRPIGIWSSIWRPIYVQSDSNLEDSNTYKIRDDPPPSQERLHKTQEDDSLGDFQSDCDSVDWGTFQIRDDLPPCQERSYTTLELFSRLIYIPIFYRPLTHGSSSNSCFRDRFGSRISTR